MSRKKEESSWSDFEIAWKSVEELKGELYRTELKLQNAGMPFAPKRKPKKHTASAGPAYFHSGTGSDENRRNKRKTYRRHKESHYSANEKSSHYQNTPARFDSEHASSFERPALHHMYPSYTGSETFRDRLFASSVNDPLVKILNIGSSSGVSYQVPSSDQLLQRFGIFKSSLKEQSTQTSLQLVNNHMITSDLDAQKGRRKKIMFSEWEREFLEKEVPGFKLSPSDVIKSSKKPCDEDEDLVKRISALRSDVKLNKMLAEQIKEIERKSEYSTKIEPEHKMLGSMNKSVEKPIHVEKIDLAQRLAALRNEGTSVKQLAEKTQKADMYEKICQIVQKQKDKREQKTAELFDEVFAEEDAPDFSSGTEKWISEISRDPSTSSATNFFRSSQTKMVRKVCKLRPPSGYTGFSPPKGVQSSLPETDLKLDDNVEDNASQTLVKTISRPEVGKKKKVRKAIFSDDDKEQIISAESMQALDLLCSDSEKKPEDSVQNDFQAEGNFKENDEAELNLEKAENKSNIVMCETIDLTESCLAVTADAELQSNKKQESGSFGDEDYIANARKLLEELSDSDMSEDSPKEIHLDESASRAKIPMPAVRRSKKRKASKTPEQHSSVPKARHYDREKVQQYIKEQQATRRKKQIEEQQKIMEAQHTKKERLKKLYEFQRRKISAKTKANPTSSKLGMLRTVPARNTQKLIHKSPKENNVSPLKLGSRPVKFKAKPITKVSKNDSQPEYSNELSDEKEKHLKHMKANGTQLKLVATSVPLPEPSSSDLKEPASKIEVSPPSVEKAYNPMVTKQNKTLDKKFVNKEKQEKESSSNGILQNVSRKSSEMFQLTEQEETHINMKTKSDNAADQKRKTVSGRVDSEDDSLTGIPSLDASDNNLNAKRIEVSEKDSHKTSLRSNGQVKSSKGNCLKLKENRSKSESLHNQDINIQMLNNPPDSTDTVGKTEDSVASKKRCENEQVQMKKKRISLLMEQYSTKVAEFFNKNGKMASMVPENNEPLILTDGDKQGANEPDLLLTQKKPDPYNFINTWKRKPLIIPLMPLDSILYASSDEFGPVTPEPDQLADAAHSADERQSYTTDFSSEPAANAAAVAGSGDSSVEQRTIKTSTVPKESKSNESFKRVDQDIKEALFATDIGSEKKQTSSESEIFEDRVSEEHTLTPPLVSIQSNSSSKKTSVAEEMDIHAVKSSSDGTQGINIASKKSSAETLESFTNGSKKTGISIEEVIRSSKEGSSIRSSYSNRSQSKIQRSSSQTISNVVDKSYQNNKNSKKNVEVTEENPTYTDTIADFLDNYVTVGESRILSKDSDQVSEDLPLDSDKDKVNSSDVSAVSSVDALNGYSTELISHKVPSNIDEKFLENKDITNIKEIKTGSNRQKNAENNQKETIAKWKSIDYGFQAMQTVVDPGTIKVLTEVAGAAVKNAVEAALQNRPYVLQVPLPQKRTKSSASLSSKKEYSSDFESDHASQKNSVASAKNSESMPFRKVLTSVENYENIEEELQNSDHTSEVSDSDLHASENTRRSSKSSLSIEEVPDLKSGNGSENVTSPSPASLSDNESLASTAVSTEESSTTSNAASGNHKRMSGGTELFTELTLNMVQKMAHEEELRAQHQLTLLQFQEKSLVEKVKAELKWLGLLKKKLLERNSSDKLPVIHNRQQELMIQLRQERAQLRCLQETYRSVIMKAQQKMVAEKDKLHIENISVPSESLKRPSSIASSIKSGVKTLSPSTGSAAPVSSLEQHSIVEIAKSDDISEAVPDTASRSSSPGIQNVGSGIPDIPLPGSSNSSDGKQARPPQSEHSRSTKYESASSHFTTQSLESILQGIKRLEANKRYLTKKEQRLIQRRSHVETLLNWQKKLDREEKEVKQLEHKALEVLEKSKQKSKYYVSSSPSSPKNVSDSEKTSNKPSSSSVPTAETLAATDAAASSIRTASELKENESVEEDIRSHISDSLSSIQENLSGVKSSSVPEDGNKIEDETPISESTRLSESKTFTKEKASIRSESSNGIDKLKDFDNSRKSPSSSVMEKSPSTAGAYSESFDSLNESPNSASVSPKALSLESTRKKIRMISRSPKSRDSSGSDDSFTVSHSETASDQSDIEGRIYALTEELKRRKAEAEKLRKEQKKRHWEQLKEREMSLKKQLEAYDKYIKETSVELEQQLEAASEPAGKAISPVKPQIKKPHVAKSRHLQKQSITPHESEKSDDRNESSSSDGKDISSKERAHHTSNLVKKLRGISTKEVKEGTSEDILKEGSSTAPSQVSSFTHPLTERLGGQSSTSSQPEDKDTFTKSSRVSSIEVQVVKSPSTSSIDKNSHSHYISDFASSSSDVPTEEKYKVSNEEDKESNVENSESRKSSVEEEIPNVYSSESVENEFTEKSESNDQKHSGSESEDNSNVSQEHSYDSLKRTRSSSLTGKNVEFADKLHDVTPGKVPDDNTDYSSIGSSDNSRTNKSVRRSAPGESFDSASSIEEELKSVESNCDGSNGCSQAPSEDEETLHSINDTVSVISVGNTSGEHLRIKDPVAFEDIAISANNIKKIFQEIDIEDVTGVSSSQLLDTTFTIDSAVPTTETYNLDDSNVETLDKNEQKTVVSAGSTKKLHQETAIAISDSIINSLLRDSINTIVSIITKSTGSYFIKGEQVRTSAPGHIDSNNQVATIAHSVDYAHTEPIQLANIDHQTAGSASLDNRLLDEASQISATFTQMENDTQNLVRQYPYYYRQIPNKPPPPYTPPSASVAAPRSEPADIMKTVHGKLDEVVDKCIETILEGKNRDLEVCEIEPPSEYIAPDDADFYTKNEKSYLYFIFELVKETTLKIYSEYEEPYQPWLRHQKLARRPVLPKDKFVMLPVVLRAIRKFLKLDQEERPKPSIWAQMKLGNKKRDFVDMIIIDELKEEEPEWINYDEDEFHVKLQLTESIFKLLLDDTARTMQRIIYGASRTAPPVSV